jgi:hypothetical protein
MAEIDEESDAHCCTIPVEGQLVEAVSEISAHVVEVSTPPPASSLTLVAPPGYR